MAELDLGGYAHFYIGTGNLIPTSTNLLATAPDSPRSAGGPAGVLEESGRHRSGIEALYEEDAGWRQGKLSEPTETAASPMLETALVADVEGARRRPGQAPGAAEVAFVADTQSDYHLGFAATVVSPAADVTRVAEAEGAGCKPTELSQALSADTIPGNCPAATAAAIFQKRDVILATNVEVVAQTCGDFLDVTPFNRFPVAEVAMAADGKADCCAPGRGHEGMATAAASATGVTVVAEAADGGWRPGNLSAATEAIAFPAPEGSLGADTTMTESSPAPDGALDAKAEGACCRSEKFPEAASANAFPAMEVEAAPIFSLPEITHVAETEVAGRRPEDFPQAAVPHAPPAPGDALAANVEDDSWTTMAASPAPEARLAAQGEDTGWRPLPGEDPTRTAGGGGCGQGAVPFPESLGEVAQRKLLGREAEVAELRRSVEDIVLRGSASLSEIRHTVQVADALQQMTGLPDAALPAAASGSGWPVEPLKRMRCVVESVDSWEAVLDCMRGLITAPPKGSAGSVAELLRRLTAKWLELKGHTGTMTWTVDLGLDARARNAGALVSALVDRSLTGARAAGDSTSVGALSALFSKTSVRQVLEGDLGASLPQMHTLRELSSRSDMAELPERDTAARHTPVPEKLLDAISKGDARTVEDMLCRGVVEFGSARDAHGRSILWHAIARQSPQAAVVILRRFPPGSLNGVDLGEIHPRRADSLLHLMCSAERFGKPWAELFRSLLAVVPKELREHLNCQGQNFIHIAAARLNFWVLSHTLSSHSGAVELFTQRDGAGWSPLALLARHMS